MECDGGVLQDSAMESPSFASLNDVTTAAPLLNAFSERDSYAPPSKGTCDDDYE
jgi:hypothetical protein